ncbi:MAG TPA: hypothetical protein VFN03_12075, partial [Trueperaceae bacterium]|nr:hypothetical protein [Trueperaceae bacterium]
MNGSVPRRSVYVSPAAMCAAPSYARRLVEEAGVECFVLRTGFDPTSTSSYLEQAVALVKALDARCWFLVGTWWGDGVDPADEAMTAVADDLLTSD